MKLKASEEWEVRHDSQLPALRRLGLELKPANAPVEMLVIDHAEKPDAN